jgi:hypothetical protein
MTIKSTGWTIEKRIRVAKRTRAQKPWLQSTGPKTAAGKKRASQNAYRHGRSSARYKAAYRRLSMLLMIQKRHSKAIINPSNTAKVLCFTQKPLYNTRL